VETAGNKDIVLLTWASASY